MVNTNIQGYNEYLVSECAALGWASEANNLSLEGSAREPAPERLGPAAESSLYQYVLYFLYSGYSQTFLDAVFDADHDARTSSGQGWRQLAAFQRQSRGLGAISGENGCQPAGQRKIQAVREQQISVNPTFLRSEWLTHSQISAVTEFC